MYKAVWESEEFEGLECAIVEKISKLSAGNYYHWSCRIVKRLSTRSAIGTVTFFMDSELTKLIDPVDILKEML